jgi:hypothetical protein
MLAVATDVMVKSEAVRRQVLAAGNDKEAEVLFKSRALAAGGALVSQQADEGFYSLA